MALLYLVLLSVVFLFWYFLFGLNPDECHCGNLNPIDPPCGDNIEICYGQSDTLRLSPYECKSIVIYWDSTQINSECDIDFVGLEVKEVLDEVIVTLQHPDSSHHWNRGSLPPVIKKGRIRHCLCDRPIFIYENEDLDYFRMETVVAGGNRPPPPESNGGTFSPNFIFEAEGNVPLQISELVRENKNCFVDGVIDTKRIHPVSDLSIDYSIEGHSDLDMKPTLIESVKNFWRRHYYCPDYRSCWQALEPYGASDTKLTFAILDTGVDFLMMEDGAMYNERDSNSDCFNSDFVGWNFVNNTPDIDDECGHGTTVALSYLHGLKTLNFNILKQQIMPVQVLNECGRGTLFDITCGLYYAIDKEADVINMSLGTYLDSCRMLQRAIDTAAYHGLAVVTSAGNDSLNLDSLTLNHYPSEFNGLHTGNYESRTFEVGALCSNPLNLTSIDNENTEPWDSTNYRKEVFAEGGVHYQLLFRDYMDITNIGSIDGTSFSCPVFGAALIKESFDNSVIPNTNFMLSEIQDKFQSQDGRVRSLSYFKQ